MEHYSDQQKKNSQRFSHSPLNASAPTSHSTSPISDYERRVIKDHIRPDVSDSNALPPIVNYSNNDDDDDNNGSYFNNVNYNNDPSGTFNYDNPSQNLGKYGSKYFNNNEDNMNYENSQPAVTTATYSHVPNHKVRHSHSSDITFDKLYVNNVVAETSPKVPSRPIIKQNKSDSPLPPLPSPSIKKQNEDFSNHSSSSSSSINVSGKDTKTSSPTTKHYQLKKSSQVFNIKTSASPDVTPPQPNNQQPIPQPLNYQQQRPLHFSPPQQSQQSQQSQQPAYTQTQHLPPQLPPPQQPLPPLPPSKNQDKEPQARLQKYSENIFTYTDKQSQQMPQSISPPQPQQSSQNTNNALLNNNKSAYTEDLQDHSTNLDTFSNSNTVALEKIDEHSDDIPLEIKKKNNDGDGDILPINELPITLGKTFTPHIIFRDDDVPGPKVHTPPSNSTSNFNYNYNIRQSNDNSTAAYQGFSNDNYIQQNNGIGSNYINNSNYQYHPQKRLSSSPSVSINNQNQQYHYQQQQNGVSSSPDNRKIQDEPNNEVVDQLNELGISNDDNKDTIATIISNNNNINSSENQPQNLYLSPTNNQTDNSQLEDIMVKLISIQIIE
ncbi:8362_t:CDS:2 [Entrophospora sp. SA101]|nr:8355_t:CDS:2 [Entrophospora sp. SA101]CAJ0889467.1 8362_t:CDS:2 [Entrophospora sp. SA101]